MNQPSDVSVCGGSPVSVNFSGSSGATFTWTNSNPSIGLPPAGTGNLNFTTAQVPQQETATITVTPVNVSGGHSCPGESKTFTITVNGSTVVDPPNITVCPYTPVSVNFSGNGSTYTWTNSNTLTGLDASGTGDIAFVSEGAATPQTATVTVTPQPCPAASQTFTITVLVAPIVDDLPDVTVCAGKPLSVLLSGSAGTTFTWTNNNPAIGLAASGNGPLLNFTAANVQTTQNATISVVPAKGGCTGPPVIFTITVLKCCVTTAGALDTTALSVCGPKTVTANYLGGHIFAPGDTLRFILYSNPANPLGSIVQYSDSLRFPFLPGVMHFDSTYYLAAIAGLQLPNDSIDAAALCFSLVHGPKLKWRQLPAIAVSQPPQSVCYDGCTEVLFTLTGTPPFEFNWLILQDGQVLVSKVETSAGYEKTVVVCPQDFGGMGGYINFRVNFFRDKVCTCGD